MNPLKHRSREYRVLAIAVLFFSTGLLFFWFDRPASTNTPSSVSVSAPTASAGGSVQSPEPEFANYPEPSKFNSFSYTQSGFDGNASLTLTAKCNAAYIAVLLFPAAIDYRSNVTSAVYNKAFPCNLGQSFSLTIATSDLGRAPFGKYYRIVADQGTSGTWYNPR